MCIIIIGDPMVGIGVIWIDFQSCYSYDTNRRKNITVGNQDGFLGKEGGGEREREILSNWFVCFFDQSEHGEPMTPSKSLLTM